MRRILVTGMSGTGKSTALAELQRRGFAVVDTDVGPWTEWSEAEGGYVWREDLVAELLSREESSTLYVSGAVSNQGRSRTTNDFGKRGEERAAILGDLAEVEPRLRATCTHELDATRPLDEVVVRLVEIGTGAGRA